MSKVRALSTALRLLQHDPLREDAHRLAMRVYCRLGQRNAALEQYHRCLEMVQAELGTKPMVETIDLYHAILEGRFVLGRSTGAASGVGGRASSPHLMVATPSMPSRPAGW